jgi:hypothetical protein
VPASDVIVLGISRHDVIEVLLSSYGLSLFSLKVGSHPEENIVSLSVSVGEVWSEIDLLDDVSCGVTFAVPAWEALGDQTSRSHADPQGSRKLSMGSLHID